MKKRPFLFLLMVLLGASPLMADPPPTEDDETELPMPAPTTTLPSQDYKKQFTGTLIAIIAVVSLVFLIIWLLRRFTTHRPLSLSMNHRKHIKVLERRPLSPNTFIYLLQVGDKQFIIAESKFHVHNVATLDWKDVPPEN